MKKQTADNLLENILNSSLGVSIIATDLRHRITFWNRGAENIFGFTPSEIIGSKVDALYSDTPETREKVLLLRNSVAAGKTLTVEIQQKRRNGSPVWVSLTVAPRTGRNGKLAGALGIGEDITEKRAAQEKYSALEQQLMQSQKMDVLGRLAGSIAHDFNNYLAAIMGYSGIIRKNLSPSDMNSRDLEEIISVTKSAACLAGQLLAFSRKQPAVLQPLNVNEILAAFEKILINVLGTGIELVFDLGKNLPEVNFDKNQLLQVIVNLAMNARDAGAGRLTIKTSLPADKQGNNEFVEITVADNGEGMGDEVKKHLFEPFFTTKEPGKGTGLGLSVVYGIIKQHNGFITVDSRPGAGTIFKITLPCGRPQGAL
ncbi:MAG: hypothetical protein A2297_09860 [Elusimicrobia bacterium RIFOXYB2_FULL_48_7]|nr:MAG: hypothetical protein A2297_09860 [Elusimicrobia bacterium RIFOXYB2_FULL_48_7]